MKEKFPCPCCGYMTLPEVPPGTYFICPVCRWEDDGVQYDDPNYEGGANSMSLNQAKDNFKKYHAKDKASVNKVRKPAKDEVP